MPIVQDTGWQSAFVFSGVSLAMLVAGFVSPKIGRIIQAYGGRLVLAASSILFASGLAVMAFAPSLPVYIAAWVILGFGMAAGLYDPAFAALGRQYGQDARRMITAITLYGGFASTVAWPISAFLITHFGWRVACEFYAALHLLIGLPAYLFVLPKSPPDWSERVKQPLSHEMELPRQRQNVAFVLLGVIVVIGSITLSMMGTHFVALLQSRGLELAVAVSFGTLIGPSAVGARFIELTVGCRFHPVWTMLVGVLLVAIGMMILAMGYSLIALAIIAYGAGNGIASVVRGTVPLVLFGPHRYAVLMGHLGFLVLLGMAAAPTLGAVLIDSGGANLTFGLLMVLSIANVSLVLFLVWWCHVSVGSSFKRQS